MNLNDQLTTILTKVKNNEISIDDAKEHLRTYEDLGFATLDLHRQQRTGFPEVIYAESKTVEQVKTIFEHLAASSSVVLATRVTEEMGQIVKTYFPNAEYNKTARTILLMQDSQPVYDGYVAVVCAGTSDLPVAEEAVTTVKALGSKAELICDVGVAGLHRLINKIDIIRNANVVIVVAGMEGALPSVVGGLVSKPVIAVPTSVGYGSNFNGLSALLGMLNSCANGISVVNIDNGYGAGYQAGLINRLIHSKGE